MFVRVKGALPGLTLDHDIAIRLVSHDDVRFRFTQHQVVQTACVNGPQAQVEKGVCLLGRSWATKPIQV